MFLWVTLATGITSPHKNMRHGMNLTFLCKSQFPISLSWSICIQQWSLTFPTFSWFTFIRGRQSDPEKKASINAVKQIYSTLSEIILEENIISWINSSRSHQKQGTRIKFESALLSKNVPCCLREQTRSKVTKYFYP